MTSNGSKNEKYIVFSILNQKCSFWSSLAILSNCLDTTSTSSHKPELQDVLELFFLFFHTSIIEGSMMDKFTCTIVEEFHLVNTHFLYYIIKFIFLVFIFIIHSFIRVFIHLFIHSSIYSWYLKIDKILFNFIWLNLLGLFYTSYLLYEWKLKII